MGKNVHTFAPSLHRVIVFADVPGFSAPHRDDADRLTIRTEFYNVMRTAFAKTGVSWENCHREDRGDGQLILVPPEISSEGMAELMLRTLPQILAVALHQHNQARPPGSRFRLRLAIHAGEVHTDDSGYSGASIIHAARLLGAEPLKHAQAASSAPLALIVSETFFLNVIWDTPALDPAAYQRMEIAVKETGTVAWVRLFDQLPRLALPDGGDTRYAVGPKGGRPDGWRGTRDFDAFYLAQYRFIRNIVNTRAQDWTLASEVTDEAMTIAYRRWDDLVEHPNLVGFVVVTARRILSRIQRQRARKAPPVPPLSLDATPGLELAAPGADPADTAVHQMALRQALKALPADQRECFVLHEILDQPIRDIAELLNLPEGTVKTRLRAARQALRDLLNDDLGEGGIR